MLARTESGVLYYSRLSCVREFHALTVVSASQGPHPATVFSSGNRARYTRVSG